MATVWDCLVRGANPKASGPHYGRGKTAAKYKRYRISDFVVRSSI